MDADEPSRGDDCNDDINEQNNRRNTPRTETPSGTGGTGGSTVSDDTEGTTKPEFVDVPQSYTSGTTTFGAARCATRCPAAAATTAAATAQPQPASYPVRANPVSGGTVELEFDLPANSGEVLRLEISGGKVRVWYRPAPR